MTTSSTIFFLETSWPKEKVKPILKTRNANDVGMHNSKRTKFTIKKTKIRQIESDIRLTMQ